MREDQTRTGPSRRRLLAGTGAAGAGLMAASAGVLPGVTGSARASTAGSALQRGRLSPGVPPDSAFFGRIFPGLAPFADATDTVRAALLEVGMQGGIMDAGDDLAAGPKNLIVDPAVNGNPTAANPYGTNPDNPTMTAGSTFVGQFTDHDITFDQRPPWAWQPTRWRRRTPGRLRSTWTRCSEAVPACAQTSTSRTRTARSGRN